jgi:lysophospholipase L1-like esterase
MIFHRAVRKGSQKFIANKFFVVLILFIFTAHTWILANPRKHQIEEPAAIDLSLIRQSIEDPGGNALINFYDALARTREGGVARVMHYGDSHIAADILTAVLRHSFQDDFGDAGTGYILPGLKWPWYSRHGITNGGSAGWNIVGIGNKIPLEEDNHVGLGGLSLTTDRADERLWVSAPSGHFDLYLLKQPGGGSIDVALDGAKAYQNISLKSDHLEPFYLNIDAVTDTPDGLHTLELTTLTAGATRVLGVVLENDSSGVVYDALGINGARATRPLSWDWNILSSNIKRRNPDLIIVAYGSNEVSDSDLELNAYEKNFSHLLAQLRAAAPQASLLVIAPPDRNIRVGRNWRAIGAMPGLIEAQRQAAFSNGAAFWNLYHGMGGAGSINNWTRQAVPLAQPDHVHLTKPGYEYVAKSFYQEVMKSYKVVSGNQLLGQHNGAKSTRAPAQKYEEYEEWEQVVVPIEPKRDYDPGATITNDLLYNSIGKDVQMRKVRKRRVIDSSTTSATPDDKPVTRPRTVEPK